MEEIGVMVVMDMVRTKFGICIFCCFKLKFSPYFYVHQVTIEEVITEVITEAMVDTDMVNQNFI